MPLPDNLVSLADANTENTGKTEWNAASTQVRNVAIERASEYFRITYRCKSTVPVTNETGSDDVVKKAVALLAYEYVKAGNVDTTFFPVSSSTSIAGGQVTKVRRKLGPLETETNYQGASVSTVNVSDKFPRISALLAGQCFLKDSGGHKPTFVVGVL